MFTHETVASDDTEDALWRDAYQIAWVGACNPRAVQRTLDEHIAAHGDEHIAVRAIAGHLAYLHKESLGPTFAELDAVCGHARRLGLAV